MHGLARYELVRVLGEGGMGRVYEAVHRPSGARVAVKVLRSEVRRDRVRRRMLLDEATVAAKLDHPRIVRLLDVGRDDDGAPFLVMELAEGEPLDRLVARWIGFRPIAGALLDVLEGLAAAHAAGIVHRDLKLGNVIVDPTSHRARILDFGVAAELDLFRERGAGVVVGTPEYMAPEQLSGDGPIGPWTDLYSFGVMLAEVIRGSSPFAGVDRLTPLLVAKCAHVPPSASPARRGLIVPRALDDLIERLLRPHPRARPRFAVDVRAELSSLMGAVRDEVEVAPRSFVDLGAKTNTAASDLPSLLPAARDLAFGAEITRLRDVPLVGRGEERAELAAMVEEVATEGGARLLAFVGEAGIGKSRLARWGLAYVEETGTMEGAACGYDPFGAGVAFGLRHALRRILGVPLDGRTGAWSWLAAEPGLDLERLARWLGPGSELENVPTDVVVDLAHRALRAAGRLRPIYLWLDDLGWARDGSIELVKSLLDAGDVPVLLVATVRTGDGDAAVRERLESVLRHRRARVREVIQLGSDERALLLEHVVRLAPGVARRLAERIEGSPLLLVQLVHDWRARGLLEFDGAVYAPRGGASVDELLLERPLDALFADRVDDLLRAFGPGADVAAGVLGRAALLGRRFEHAALEAACARHPELAAALDEVLDRALLAGVVRAARAGVYTFDHPLVQEALTARIEPQRAEAALDVANALFVRYGRERADLAALIARLQTDPRPGAGPRPYPLSRRSARGDA